MTAREAELLADQLWGNGETRFGRARRGRKSPKFSVGYADVGGTATTVATSDVDWESAFALATGALR